MLTYPVLGKIEATQTREGIPEFRVGDTVRVHYRIVEGEKERVQVFQGVVLKRHRAGVPKHVHRPQGELQRRCRARVLAPHPRIEKVEVVSRGVVRRARLFYLRSLAGKAARVRDAKD